MAILKEVINKSNGTTAKYIRIEFIYIINNKTSAKTVFVRIGLYADEKYSEYIDFEERNYSFEELNFTGKESIYELVYDKLKEAYTDATGNLTNSSSDARVKKNVETLSEKINVLDSLKQIRGVTYNWDNSIKGYENMGEQQEIGVIAQEIERFIPQVVGENSTGYKSVDYAKLTAYLIEVNKALLEKIETLEAKVI